MRSYVFAQCTRAKHGQHGMGQREAGQTNFNILHKLLSWSRPTLVFKLESGMDAFKSCFLVIIIVRLIIWLFYSFLGVDILLRK